MTKLILVIFIALSQCMKDLQTQTINLSGRQEKEHRFLSKILLNFQNVRGLKEEVSNERFAKTRIPISRKFFKKLLSNKFARATKNGFIEIQLEKTQPGRYNSKTNPIVVYGQRYVSTNVSSNLIWEPKSRFIRFH